MSKELKLLLYCTKAKPYLTRGNDGSVYPSCVISDGIQEWHLNGKIVAECDFEVEKITTFKDYTGYEEYDIHYQTAKRDYERLLQETCLNNQQLDNYLQGENGYAIHIKNLHIFDEPKELNKCWANTNAWRFSNHRIEKAPQNMQYCGNWNLEKCILISIQPQWLCKILNGEKTIEVRKKILKEMMSK
jgi:predicted transcriptional regulator